MEKEIEDSLEVIIYTEKV